MKFGTFHLMEHPFTKTEQQVYDDTIEQIRAADASGLATSRDPGGKPDAADASAHRDSYVVSSSRGYSTSQSELRATAGRTRVL